MFVTPFYAGLLALWFVVLSARIVNIRRRGLLFGDDGDPTIRRMVRAQANFAEYVPFALLMMGFLEAGRHSIYVLHALGIALLAARIAGTSLTFVVLLVEAVACIAQGIRGQALWGL